MGNIGGTVGTPITLQITSDPFELGTRVAFNGLGINDLAQVVGGFVDSEENVHAFLWSPGDGPSGWRDLHVEAYGSSTTILMSFANDLNNDGVIVGQAGVDLTDDTKATAWLPGTTYSAVNLNSTSQSLSIAYEISEFVEGEAVIVGEVKAPCPIPGAPYQRPFRIVGFTTSSTPSMTILDITDPRHRGFAHGVEPTGASSLTAGGEIGTTVGNDPCTAGVLTTQCPLPDYDAAWWNVASTAATRMFPIDEADGNDENPKYGAMAYGINSSDDIVGLGWRPLGPLDEEEVVCEMLALLWPVATTTEAPFELGDVMPAGMAGASSRAHGVTPRDETECVTVVGWNTAVSGTGLAWRGSPSTPAFCAIDLQADALPCSREEVTVQFAFDVNVHGHVSVLLLVDDEIHAGVLTAAADIVSNFKVDGDDLGAVLVAWCSSGCTSTDLDSDLNCDGIVDGDDLSTVLVSWSGSALCTVRPPCEHCDEENEALVSGGSVDISDFTWAESTLGFESLDALASWAQGASAEQVSLTAQSIIHIAASAAEEES